MRLLSTLLAAVLATTAFSAVAAEAKDPVEARKAMFKDYKKVFGQGMGAVMKGEKPYNKDEFAKLAEQMVELSKQPWQYFPAGSDKGKSEARPEVWSKPAEFKKAADEHQALIVKQAGQVLADSNYTKGGDLAQIRPAFAAAQKTCKACHEVFKKD